MAADPPPPGGLSLDSLNPALLKAEYAVRGAIALKAQEYATRLAKGDTSLPFARVYQCNIGESRGMRGGEGVAPSV